MAASLEPAEVASTDNSITNEDSPAFFCRHCQSAYSQPKILKCLHSFCAQCLDDTLVKSDDKKTVVCPLCSYATDVPASGVEGLTHNSFLERVSSEYVKDVKNNLAAKSQNTPEDKSDQPNDPSLVKPKTSGITSSFRQQELFTNLTDEEKSESSKQHILKDGATVPGGESPAVEGIQNANRMQAKIMGLQEEALRVAYAIDRANHHKIEWLQHREDLKRAIQRRSAQFQMLVKKMERQLVSQIDEKTVEDRFYESLDQGKTELRKNLKQVLHGVSIIKGVREMGNYSEINELSSSLLSPCVGVNEVILSKISYQLDLPKKSIEEMVSVGFGNLVMTTEERSIYLPDAKDYTHLKMEEINSEEDKSHAIAFNSYGIRSAISGDSRATMAGIRRSSSTTGRQTQRRSSDIGRTDVLEEFQNARESLRNRRQEILMQGQTSRDFATWRPERRRSSRPTSRRGRAQSLDRSSPAPHKNRTLFNLDAKEEPKRDLSEDDDARGFMMSTDEKHEEVTMPSPIMEEAVTITSPKKGGPLEVSLSDISAVKRGPEPMSPIESVASEKVAFELLQLNRNWASPSSSTSSSRRVSFDRSPSMSPTMEHLSSDLYGKNSSRQLRRAITSAADKKSKIEFLRENWQKRKEILIQNQGFVSSEDITSPIPDTKGASVSIAGNTPPSSTDSTAAKIDNSAHTQIPLASRGIGSPPLRSKFTSVKRTQKQQRQYEESPESSPGVQPYEETSRNIKRSVIPVSLLDEQMKQMAIARGVSPDVTAGVSTLERLRDLRSPSQSSDAPDAAMTIKSQQDQGEEEEEEEITVVETETITIPVTEELLRDVKTAELPHAPLSSSSAREFKSGTTARRSVYERQNKESDTDEEEEKETVIEETVIVKIPDVSQSQMVMSSQAPVTTRKEIASQISPTSGRYSWRSPGHGVDSVSKSTTLISSPIITASPSSTPPATIRTSQRFSYTFNNEPVGESTTTDVVTRPGLTETSSFRQRTQALPSLTTSLQTSTESLSSTTVTTTTAASASSSVTTITQGTTTTTTSATAPSPSSPVPSSPTPSSTARRYSSRYTDVAAPVTNLYNPSPSTAYSAPNNSKTEDNKENVDDLGANNSSIKQTNKDKPESSQLQYSSNRSVQTPLDVKAPSSTNRELKEDTSINKNQHDTTSSNTERKPTRSLYQRNYYGPATHQTTPNPYAKDTNLQSNQTNSAETTTMTKTTQAADIIKTNQDATDSKDSKTAGSITPQTTRPSRNVSSLYSNYYSNLYSKPPEITTTSNKDENPYAKDTNLQSNQTNSAETTTMTKTKHAADIKTNQEATEGKDTKTAGPITPQPTRSSRNVSSLYSNYYSNLYSKPLETTSTSNKDENPYAKDTTLQQSNQTNSAETTTMTKTTHAADIIKTNQDATDSKDTKTAGPITPQPPRPSRNVSSLYSNYYSNPNNLYSKPTETTSTSSKDDGHHQSPQDQKVDETFTQAESSRRLYDPATPTSAQSRRHTVEIGKTIPKGVKISDLYKGKEAEGGKSPDTPNQAIRTIEESPESEGEMISIGLQSNRRPRLFPSRSFSSSILSQSQAEDPLQGDFRNSKRETRPRVTFATGQHVPASPSALSTASSPASSPMTDEKKSIVSDQSDDSASSSSSRNLKDIARKKRERWRRLTVY